MMFRWELQCTSLETGETSLQTFVGKDEASVRDEAGSTGFLVEKVISFRRLDTEDCTSSPSHDPGTDRWSAVQHAVNKAELLRLPLDTMLQAAWVGVSLGIAGVVAGVFVLLLFEPSIGVTLVRLSVAVLSLCALGTIILTAARSVCICLLVRANHTPRA